MPRRADRPRLAWAGVRGFRSKHRKSVLSVMIASAVLCAFDLIQFEAKICVASRSNAQEHPEVASAANMRELAFTRAIVYRQACALGCK
jgi:hypothetical protein